MSAEGYVRTVALCITLGIIGGCSSAPRQSPIPTTRINSGEGSLQAIRQKIAGTWDLVSYRTYENGGVKLDHRAAV